MPDPTLRALRRLQGGTARNLDALMSGVQSGRLSGREAFRRASELLRLAHTHAAALGERRAGGVGPRFAEELARRVIREERGFLRGMVADAAAGRYRRGGEFLKGAQARQARASLYALKLSGTANAAWVAGVSERQGPVLFTWQLGGTDHCSDCPDLAAGSPYTEEGLPSFPGDGGSECLTRCACELVTEAGDSGFQAGSA